VAGIEEKGKNGKLGPGIGRADGGEKVSREKKKDARHKTKRERELNKDKKHLNNCKKETVRELAKLEQGGRRKKTLSPKGGDRSEKENCKVNRRKKEP